MWRACAILHRMEGNFWAEIYVFSEMPNNYHREGGVPWDFPPHPPPSRFANSAKIHFTASAPTPSYLRKHDSTGVKHWKYYDNVMSTENYSRTAAHVLQQLLWFWLTHKIEKKKKLIRGRKETIWFVAYLLLITDTNHMGAASPQVYIWYTTMSHADQESALHTCTYHKLPVDMVSIVISMRHAYVYKLHQCPRNQATAVQSVN